MAKKKITKVTETVTEVTEEPKSKEIAVSIRKYFQLAEPPIHIYTKAALEVQYRDELKTQDEWERELKEYFDKGV